MPPNKHPVFSRTSGQEVDRSTLRPQPPSSVSVGGRDWKTRAGGGGGERRGRARPKGAKHGSKHGVRIKPRMAAAFAGRQHVCEKPMRIKPASQVKISFTERRARPIISVSPAARARNNEVK